MSLSTQIAGAVKDYTAQRVALTSKKSIKDVLAALDVEVNKEGGRANTLRIIANAQTKEELEAGMDELTKGGKLDFVLFATFSHSRWLAIYLGREFPETHVYIIGNPLIAQTMLQHDIAAGLHIPPKLLVTEIEGGKGTTVVFDLPSSVIAVGNNVSPELKKAAEGLDEKLERLVRKVLS
ncbi:hypothetical protein EUX98_g4176 [Antrodiella citrinella]|uniref:DUF302 domain-containing protein n=1 Tax=Antrodiella citrinella TaxID=2447956 RepID=A0A4S4N2Q1_9APHY|nr:hypothetical protein EUX98_g4176 [Antrodiella citrinella]